MRRSIYRATTIAASFSFSSAGDVGRARATIAASFSTAGDGGRGHGFLPTDPNSEKSNVRRPHTFVKRQVVTAGKQLKNEERARKAGGILFRDYGGRATQDEGPYGDPSDEEKVAKTVAEAFKEELDAFIECEESEYEECKCGREELEEVLEYVIEKMTQDDELADGPQNNRVNELAEKAKDFEEELDIECEPKFEKRYRKVLEKVRGKMIQDDMKLNAFEFLIKLMNRCDPEYEKLLREVLEEVCEKNDRDDELDDGPRETQNYRGNELANENIGKIEKLAKKVEKEKFAMPKIGRLELLDQFVTQLFLTNLRRVEKNKPIFIAFEVIEKLAKKVENENIRKIAEEELDAFVTKLFDSNLVIVDMMQPFFMGKWKD